MPEYEYSRIGAHGRLGNQLWQMASTIGRAIADGAEPVFDPNWEYRPYFNVPDEYFGRIKHKRSSSDFSNPVNGYTDYMQRYTEFARSADHIHEIFQPSELAIEGIKERWPEFYQTDKPRVSVHVRRGDYLKHSDLFPSPTGEYRRAALNTALMELGVEEGMPEQEAKELVDILVFSDDISWCRENFSEHFNFVEGVARPVEVRNRKGAPEDQYDLFLMADCDKHVIANSSYSWWGAFLSEDESPFYPSVWFGSQIPEYPVWRKMMPDSWRETEC